MLVTAGCCACEEGLAQKLSISNFSSPVKSKMKDRCAGGDAGGVAGGDVEEERKVVPEVGGGVPLSC